MAKHTKKVKKVIYSASLMPLFINYYSPEITIESVSYTHLDVYKRQGLRKSFPNHRRAQTEHVKPNLFSLKRLLNSMSATIISVLMRLHIKFLDCGESKVWKRHVFR